MLMAPARGMLVSPAAYRLPHTGSACCGLLHQQAETATPFAAYRLPHTGSVCGITAGTCSHTCRTPPAAPATAHLLHYCSGHLLAVLAAAAVSGVGAATAHLGNSLEDLSSPQASRALSSPRQQGSRL
jgi:hypothetical protein